MAAVQQPSRSRIQQRASSIPLIESGEVLDERHSLALFHDLEALMSSLPEQIQQQIDDIHEEIKSKLPKVEHGIETMYGITDEQLRGTIARAAIAASAQTVSDIGENLRIAEQLRQILEVDDPSS